MAKYDFPLLVLPTHTNLGLESLGTRPTRVENSRIGQCVEQYKNLFAAKGFRFRSLYLTYRHTFTEVDILYNYKNTNDGRPH